MESSMKIPEKQFDVGVVIGRFQVSYLHEAHMELVNFVRSRHSRVLILLGMSPCKLSHNNPLDFDCRRQMLGQAFPEITVLYVKDMASNEHWSRQVDSTISDVIGPGKTVVLYGGRDSFIKHYSGRYTTQELGSDHAISGSLARKLIGIGPLPSLDFRAGVIFASRNKFPTVFGTVDVAVFDDQEENMLLGRKPNEDLFRFIGGFSEPRGGSDEADARREVMEEAGIDITDPVYVGSFDVEDWRYRGEPDSVRTRFFRAKKFSGLEKAGDDIAEIRWFNFSTLGESQIVPEHHALLRALKKEK
jgi:bifunctional NMN adenylyltransferase/nudix hydrolase